MVCEKMRAEFEEAITKDRVEAGYDEPDLSMIEWEEAQVYVQNYIQAAWWGWQASRAALVVELPPKGLSADPELPGNAWHNTRNNTIEACRRAIESAGIKVK